MSAAVVGTSSSVLRDRNFAAILASKTSSTVASAMTWVVLPLYVYQVSHSPLLAAIASAANVVPYILFGLLAGVLVDRASPRRVMVVVELCNALILLVVPALVVLHGLTVTTLCLVGFASATAFVWFDVASSALVPSLVGPDRVFQANGYLWSVATLITAVAAPAGFALLNAAGVGRTFEALAVFYAGSAALLCLTRDVRRAARQSVADPDQPVVRTSRGREMIDGLRYIRDEPTVRVLTMIGLGSGISAGAVYGMIVVFANRALGLGTHDFRISWIIGASSVGALFASFVAPRLRRRDPMRIVVWLLVLDTTLMATYALSKGWTMALGVIALWNLTHTTLMIVSISVRQVLAPAALLGRVNAAARMLAWGSVPLGSAICGALTPSLGSRHATLLLAVPLLASFVLAAGVARRARTAPASPTDKSVPAVAR